MTGLTERNCLLIFPKTFYSFAKVLAAGLEQRGYAVVTANEEYPENAFGKMLGKLGLHTLLEWTTEKAISRKFLQGHNYELVLVVKGRGLDLGLSSACAVRAPGWWHTISTLSATTERRCAGTGT